MNAPANLKKCEFCDKRGVPILPLRYAVAPGGSGAPSTTAAVALPAKAAHYTRRLLRAGYLYVYDEARDRWTTYFVTPQAYFMKLAETPGVVPVIQPKPFNCPDEGHRAVASCITIPDARTATKVWLGFSDVQWTPKVRALHENAAYRRRHMRCVNVNAFASSPDSAHCLGIHTAGKEVAEYAMDARAASAALGWSPFELDARQQRTARLIQECESLAPGKGFAVVLDDPAGIATELGALMQHNLDQFTSDKARQRELAVSGAIEQIEQSVRAQARAGEEQVAEQQANEMLGQPDIGMLFPGYRQKKLAQIEEIRTVTEAEARRAEDQAWKRYSTKFDEPAAKAWRARFDQELKAHDTDFIAPLAQAHAVWMKSPALAAQFECNHDAQDADAGIAYAKTLQLCIGSTQDKAACFDVYTQWLGGDVKDKANLLLRALTLNLDKTADDIAKAMKVSLDWRGFPLDAVTDGTSQVIEHHAAAVTDSVGKLIAGVLGPLVRFMGTTTDGKVRPGLAALALYTNKPFAVVEVTGGKKAFRAMLIRELIKASGQVANQRQIERAVAVELRRLEVAGEKLEGTQKKRFVLMVDPERARAMPKGLSAPERAQWLAAAIKTPQQVEELNLSSWRAKVVNPGSAMVKGCMPYIGGLLEAVLQYNAMQKLGEDEGKAMSHEKTEAQHRLRAGIVALAGTITELVGKSVGKIANVVPRFGQGLGRLAWFVTGLGKGAGIFGAVVMAWWDAAQAIQAKDEGRTGLMWAYISSAALGVTSAVLLTLTSWTGVGLILVGLLIAVAMLIEYFKDNKVQDWLERCLWGKGPAPHYQTPEEEIAQLRIATA